MFTRSSVQVPRKLSAGSGNLGISGCTKEPGGKNTTAGFVSEGGDQSSQRPRVLKLAGQSGDGDSTTYHKIPAQGRAVVSHHERQRNGQGSDCIWWGFTVWERVPRSVPRFRYARGTWLSKYEPTWDSSSTNFYVKTAFLQSQESETVILVEPVPELRQAMSLRSNEIVQLRKKSYGLRDAPHERFNEVAVQLTHPEWIAMTLEPFLWLYEKGTVVCVAVAHVDDMVVEARSSSPHAPRIPRSCKPHGNGDHISRLES